MRASSAGMGYGVQADGHNIGGLFDLNGPGTPPGSPPMTGVMVKVESADATAEQILALGGTARPAFDGVRADQDRGPRHDRA